MRLLISLLIAISMSLGVHAAELGDDGLYKSAWMRDTFKDLGEDLAEAKAEGKRLMIIVEQRGCIYCAKMHEEVFVVPDVERMIEENFFAVQINMFGDVEVTDFDGEILTEKQAANRWGLLFTPTLMFFPEEVEDGLTAEEAAVAVMPGAFSPGTTLDLLTWVKSKGYEGDENFQKYHARMIQERQQN